MKKIITTILLVPVRIYQYVISPLTPASCRHFPTCSEYAVQALSIHGPGMGLKLATNRFLRCHPWGTHGIDPVPKIIFKNIKIQGPVSNRLKHES